MRGGGVSEATDLRFDHAVIVVPRLAPAVAMARAGGFAIAPGGRHRESPMQNALAALADGSYLELLAPVRPWLRPALRVVRGSPGWARVLAARNAIARRFLALLAGRAGFADYALCTARLEAVVAAARARGIEIDDPLPMGRERPDGERVEWRLAAPTDPMLPFLIEDVTPRARRVPDVAVHANGARGVSAVHVAAPDVPTLAARYAALLGRDAEEVGDAAARFPIGGVDVRLVRRGRADDARGPVRLTLAAPAGTVASPLLAALGVALGPVGAPV